MYITIKKTKKPENNSVIAAASTDIGSAPSSGALNPAPELDAANNNGVGEEEEADVQSEDIDDAAAPSLAAADDLEEIVDGETPQQSTADLQKEANQVSSEQLFDGASEVAPECAIDVPGIVDEEPINSEAGDGAYQSIVRSVELTEDFIADLFVERFKDMIRFDHDTGSWFGWKGSHWEKDEKDRVFDMARRQCRDLRGSDKQMASKRSIAGVESMARSDPRVAVTSAAWNDNPWLLGTPAGYVDLKTGKSVEPDPMHMVSKTTSVAPAVKGTPCPRFAAFLEQVTLGDYALQRFLQQYAGYCLTGVTDEQVLLFIYGPGGNGKSQLQNVLVEIMGSYAVTGVMDTFTATKHQRHLTEIAMLQGARLVRMSETEKDQKWSQARINQLTGGDPVTANFMRQDMFTFIPKFKLMIVGNHKPQLSAVNDAARRRFLIVPFTYKPEKPDKTLAASLRSEYPAILRWMIEGCLDWLEHGLVLPEAVKQATQSYFDDEDVFGRWISEKCQCAPDLKTKATPLYESWKEFAIANGEEPGSMKAFAEMLTNGGFKKIISDGAKYLGISLNPISTLTFSADL